MPFQPAPNIAMVSIEGVVDGCLTVNDLSWEISGGAIDPVNLRNITFATAAWVSSDMCPLLSDDWTAVRAVGVDLGSATGPRHETPIGTPGGISGEANPNNVAACVSLRTDQRGRSGHGRNFVPAIPGISVTLNTLDPTFITDLLAAYNRLVGAGLFEAGWQLVVLSRRTAGALRANGIGIPVTSCTMVGNSVRSMRSREVGHGA